MAQGFTKTELIVVLAVIALLAAALFPTVARMSKQSRDLANCASNERVLATGIAQYVQDSDNTFPWSFSTSDGAPEWGVLVDPYAKGYGLAGGPFSCPSSGSMGKAFSTNGQVIGLLDLESKTPAPGYYASVIRRDRIVQPSSIVLLGDALLSSFVDNERPVHDKRSADDFAYPHPADIKNHTLDKGWDVDWFGLSTNNHQISWRHEGKANIVFCDGHAQSIKPGDLKDNNWDVRCSYGKACEGSPKAPIYPAPNGMCGNQSPIDCQ